MDELEKLLAVCRKNGVSSVKIDNVEFHIHPDHLSPPKAKKATKANTTVPTYTPGGITVDTKIDMPDELTPEQLMFYSAQGHGDHQ